MKRLFLAIFLILALSTTAMAAKTCIHYKRAIICEGDNKYKTLDECGEPMSKKYIDDTREEWVYKYHGKIYVLKIRGDKIYKITRAN